MKYWIGVVSREHALGGIKAGFTQVCHGKSGPLKRMKAGDWFIFYSPKLEFQKPAPCKKFVGIGKVVNGNVYQADMGGGFKPFRTDVAFVEAREAPIQPLIEKLAFIKNKQSWGMQFRFGHLEIPEQDFLLIAKSMNVSFGLNQAQSTKSEEGKQSVATKDPEDEPKAKEKQETVSANNSFDEKSTQKKRGLESSNARPMKKVKA